MHIYHVFTKVFSKWLVVKKELPRVTFRSDFNKSP